MAGVVGFEPTLSFLGLVPESKSGALPLGDTPIWSHEVGSNHQPFDYKSKALTD